MGLHKKVLIAACLGAVVLLAGVSWSARLMLANGFATIESDAGHQSVARLMQALRTDLRQLRASADDYGRWNPAYDFVQGRRPEFQPENFTRDGLDTLRVQVAWIADAAGETRLALSTRGAEAGNLLPLRPEVIAKIRRSVAGLLARDEVGSVSGMLRVVDGALAFTAVRIVHSGGTGPAVGTLVFGRYVDDTLAARLAETIQSPVRFIPLDGTLRPTMAVPQAVLEWLDQGDPAVEELVLSDQAQTLDSYALLRDVEGRPLGLLANVLSRTALQLGRHTIMWVVVLLLVGFSLVVGLLVTLLNRGLRTRVEAQRRWVDQQRKLARLSRRDPLTGLPNRAHLQHLLPRLLKRAARDQTGLALLCIDLDDFKHVNDSLGHGSGDKLLKTIAARLRTSVTGRDVVAHAGGDEFVIVATGLPARDWITAIVDRIREMLAVSLEVDGVPVHVSASIGISFHPEDGLDAEQLLKHADIALNHAKDGGPGNAEFYTPELNARLRERVGLERALRFALENDELFIEYQPCFDLKTLRAVSFEALLRWRMADGTLVPPSRFIPIAEQSGLIVDIGCWVLRRVCMQLSEWQQQHVPLVPVSVNISVRQLERTPLAGKVAMLAQEMGIDANLLHFEITESTAMQNSQQQLGSLQALRNLGSRILIDDFGTGYSSLSYLKHLPVDTLKIDRAFVRDMAVDANDAAIVRAIVGVAKSLGLQLVAEGIESAEQLECLRKLDCECGQGFYFSPPISADACGALLWQLRGSPRVALEARKLRIVTPTT